MQMTELIRLILSIYRLHQGFENSGNDAAVAKEKTAPKIRFCWTLKGLFLTLQTDILFGPYKVYKLL